MLNAVFFHELENEAQEELGRNGKPEETQTFLRTVREALRKESKCEK
jgi:hypothetical protein